MRKILVFALMLGFASTIVAQQAYKYRIDSKEMKVVERVPAGIEPVSDITIPKSEIKKQLIEPPGDRNTDIVTVIDLGTAANLYGWGYAGGQQSLVNVNNDLNTVTVIHRMGGSLDPGGYSGDMAYDISKDGGLTFTNQVEFYIATENEGGTYYKDAGRYPNHSVHDPVGDNNPDDANLVYFMPVLEGVNDIWGGYAHGVANLGDTSVHTKNLLWFHDDYYQAVPSAYFLSSQGLSLSTEGNYDLVNSLYQENLILTKGYWNLDLGDFEYTQSQLDADMADGTAYPYDEKVAFSPDGQTGYICIIGDNGEAEQVSGYKGVYPIFWKTSDAGETWDGPFYVQLSGDDGIGGIVYHHLSDEIIAELYEAPVPDREDISYTTAFDCDIAVDMNNNLHISVVIGLTNETEYSISTFDDPAINMQTMFAYDIFTDDGGTTFYAEKMGGIRFLRGNFGGVSEDNRVRITTDKAGQVIFISWLDTDTPDAVENNTPNIWCRGFKPQSYLKTVNALGEDLPNNVTLFSLGMWQSYFGNAANFCFTDRGKYTIPFVYEELSDPTDELAPVQFKYIQDFSFTDADFSVQGLTEKVVVEQLSGVSQNYPNPVKNETFVDVGMAKSGNLSIAVYSLAGQLVQSTDYGRAREGSHTLTINVADLTSGVYFYTVTAGENKITHKMIVE